MFTRFENTLTGSEDGDDILFGEILNERSRPYLKVFVDGLGGNDRINSVGDQEQKLIIHGGEGNDVIRDNSAADFLYGDAGDDTIRSNYSALNRTGHDTVFGGDGNDTLVMSGRVVADAGAGDDILEYKGSGGMRLHSSLEGGDGYDILRAGPTFKYTKLHGVEEISVMGTLLINQKLLVGMTAISSVDDKSAYLTIDGGANMTAAQFDDGFHGTISGSGTSDRLDFSGLAGEIDLRGAGGDDLLIGNDKGNRIDAGPGDDTIYGGDGNDKILLEGALTTNNPGKGTNLAYAGDGDDKILICPNGASTVFGGDGNDIISQLPSYQIFKKPVELNGGAGDDRFNLDGWLTQYVKILGGAGRDVLQFKGELREGAVIETEVFQSDDMRATPEILNQFEELHGQHNFLEITLLSGGIFKPQATVGRVSLHGSTENDIIDLVNTKATRGGGQVDLSIGDDYFFGTKFEEQIFGGRGNDTFAFDDHSGHDLVLDFTHREDKLDFSRSKIIQDVKDFKHHISGDSVVFGQTTIDFQFNDENFLGRLTAADFIF